MDTPIRLGVMPPLSGIVGIYGREIARAAQIAAEEVNELGGILGRPLELVIEDDGSLPDTAVKAAETLIDEHKCQALVGNLLSNSRIAVAYRVAEPRRIPYLNFSFYEGSILSPYFFHFAALPNQQIDRMIPAMGRRYGQRMFFAGNSYEWPRGSINAAKQALDRLGGEVVGEEYLPIGVSDEQIEHLLDLVEAAKPDVFVPYFAGTDQVMLLTRFTERGLKKKMATVMGHYDEVMASRLPSYVRAGFYSSNTYFMSLDTPENHALLARLESMPGTNGLWPPGEGHLTNFGEGTYICVKAFAQAANTALSVESDALSAALRTVSIDAPQGNVTMDPETRHARVNTYLSRCEADGSFTIVEAFGAIEPALPRYYRHQWLETRTTVAEDSRLQSRMLAALTEAVVLITVADGVIVYNNSGAESLCGEPGRGLIGQTISSLEAPQPDAVADSSAEMLQDVAHRGEWNGILVMAAAPGSARWCRVTASAFTHPFYGEVALVTMRDETVQLETQARLRISESRYRRAAEGTNDGLWEWEIPSGKEYFSKRWLAILGLRKGEVTEHVDTFTALIHPDDADDVRKSVDRHLENGDPFDMEFRMRTRSGDYAWIRSRGVAERDDHGTPFRMTGFITDISSEKQADEELRSLLSSLEDSLREKDTLLNEVHHRVKNNLQMMSSLLYFQAKKATDATTEAMFVESQDRLRALSLAHETLYQSDSLSEIDLEPFLSKIFREVADGYKQRGKVVSTTFNGSTLIMSFERALPIGLILTELVTNAFKHAFTKTGGGQIYVGLTTADRTMTLSVGDNGVGMSADLLASGTDTSFGWSLVQNMCDQLGGRLDVSVDAGTHVTLTVPLAATKDPKSP